MAEIAAEASPKQKREMSRSHRFLLRMIAFLIVVIALAAALSGPLFAAFMGNPAVNRTRSRLNGNGARTSAR